MRKINDYSIVRSQNRDLPMMEHTVIGSILDEVLKEERGRVFINKTYFGSPDAPEWRELGKVGDVHNLSIITFPEAFDRERL